MKIVKFLAICVVTVFAFSMMQRIVHAAEVISVKGNVQVQSPSENEWKKVEQGMQLAIGDLIRTARNSTAEVALDLEKKNTLRIEPKTVVTLNSATADTMDRLDLAKGKVYANLENIKSGLTFEVNTPSAVAGVRGSALSVYVESDSDEVVAFKDTVFIRAFNVDKQLISEVMLPEGFKTMIERFSDPSVFYQISSREFDRFDDTLDDISSHLDGATPMRGGSEDDRRDFVGNEIDGVVEQQDIVDGQTDLTREIGEDAKIEDRLSEDDHYSPPTHEEFPEYDPGNPDFCNQNPGHPMC